MAVAGQNTRRPLARPENYCESKQTCFSYSLDKAFHLPEFQAKLLIFLPEIEWTVLIETAS